MRAINQNPNNENPFQKALEKKAKGRNTDPKSANFARNGVRRNARRTPTRQFQRGR
ncbi:hypothetical protein [Spirillospora sp. NPDC029432]|uniref:hypothetical protein n=1 Tax=Spirillospora sp. NPDC029432 TaxID=3154599 RepID=UPI003454B097